VELIGGRPRLAVTADGAGIVSHAGTALLGGLAERVGLTGWVDEELAGLGGVRKRGGGHRPGRVLADLAVMIADGGEAIADIAVLADQPGLHGSVGSPATCWRVLKAVADQGQAGLDALARGRARARERAWLARAELTGAAVPPAKAAGVDLDYLVLDLDAMIVAGLRHIEGLSGFGGRRSSRRMVAGLRAAARRAAAMLTAPASRRVVVTRLRMQARTAGALPVRARWASSR